MAQPEQSASTADQDMYPPKGSWALVHAPPPKGTWALHLAPDTALTARPALLLQLPLALLVLVVVPNLHALLNIAGIPDPALPAFALQGGYLLLAVLAAVAAAALLGARAAGGLARALGLTWNGWRGPLLALLATTPCWVGFALTSPVSPNRNSVQLLLVALLFPFAQELIYRGFGLVFTRRALGWYLLFALLVQAAAVSLIDVIQFWPVGRALSQIPAELLLLPFLSALLYAVLDMLAGYTLWCGWIWRASVAAATMVFAYYAAPSGLANILPIASAAAAILLLWLFVPRQAAPLDAGAQAS